MWLREVKWRMQDHTASKWQVRICQLNDGYFPRTLKWHRSCILQVLPQPFLCSVSVLGSHFFSYSRNYHSNVTTNLQPCFLACKSRETLFLLKVPFHFNGVNELLQNWIWIDAYTRKDEIIKIHRYKRRKVDGIHLFGHNDKRKMNENWWEDAEVITVK